MFNDTRKIKKNQNSQEFSIAVSVPETMSELQGLFPSLDESSIVRAAFESLHIDRCAAIRKVMSNDMTLEDVQAGIDTWQPGTGKIKKSDLVKHGNSLTQRAATLASNTNRTDLFPQIFELANYIDSKQSADNIRWANTQLTALILELEGQN